MKKAPCEYMIWQGIPFIRKQLAEHLINDFGLSQRETAEKLNITPAAVCQYTSKKRGCIHITDKELTEEIKASAKQLIENDQLSIHSEICRICQILRLRHSSFFFDKSEDEERK